jgi:hypothetical protein
LLKTKINFVRIFTRIIFVPNPSFHPGCYSKASGKYSIARVPVHNVQFSKFRRGTGIEISHSFLRWRITLFSYLAAFLTHMFSKPMARQLSG